jgi:hypothetical protein
MSNVGTDGVSNFAYTTSGIATEVWADGGVSGLGVSVLFVPPVPSLLLAEDGDYIITEGGDYIQVN